MLLGAIPSLALALALGLVPATTVSDGVTMWAGHHVTFGARSVPMRGRVETRTDTYVLSKGRLVDGRLVLTERACTISFRKIAGVKVWMDASALPRSQFTLSEATDGWVGMSRVKWDREDIDDDGAPGMTVHVDGICSGELHVANDSLTMATAEVSADGRRITGKSQVTIRQRILGAKGKCLALMADDTVEVVQGPFAYVQVPADTTCRSLTRSGWPIKARRP